MLGLKGKRYEDSLEKTEKSLATMWTSLIESHPNLPLGQKYKVFSQTSIRFALLLTNKQKAGREGKSYTMEEIVTLMKQDLSTPVEAVALAGLSTEGNRQESEAMDIPQAQDHPSKLWVLEQ